MKLIGIFKGCSNSISK